MADGAFQFLRATYWRWAETIYENVCPELKDAPEVLAVGDIHLENFGTWRDVEGRAGLGRERFRRSRRRCPTRSIWCGSRSVPCSPRSTQASDATVICDSILGGLPRTGLKVADGVRARSRVTDWLREIVVVNDRGAQEVLGRSSNPREIAEEKLAQDRPRYARSAACGATAKRPTCTRRSRAGLALAASAARAGPAPGAASGASRSCCRASAWNWQGAAFSVRGRERDRCHRGWTLATAGRQHRARGLRRRSQDRSYREGRSEISPATGSGAGARGSSPNDSQASRSEQPR